MTPDEELDNFENLIWCKQSLLRVMAWLSSQSEKRIDELSILLNDVESTDERRIEAIGHLIKAIESYKDKLPQ